MMKSLIKKSKKVIVNYANNFFVAFKLLTSCYITFILLLGAFYFNLGNLQPQYRSVINVIQLVALCPVPYIGTYGMNKILQPLMRDLHLLESVSQYFESYFFYLFNWYSTAEN